MSQTRKDEGDNKTEELDPKDEVEEKKKKGTDVAAPSGAPGKKETADKEQVPDRKEEPVVNQRGHYKPRAAGLNRHTPSNVKRYRRVGSPGHSVGQIRGMFIPYSREADFRRRDLPIEYPTEKLPPLSPYNKSNATRTLSRDMDPYDHRPNDMTYFSFPPDDDYRYRGLLYPPRKRLGPWEKWSLATNKGTRKVLKPPGRKALSEPVKRDTGYWVHVHRQPLNPALWPLRLVNVPAYHDVLEPPVWKRRYIGHVPRLSDRDRMGRHYWDKLMQMDADSEVLDQRLRHRAHYINNPEILETSNWVRRYYGMMQDYTDPRDWLKREREIYRQAQREQYFGVREGPAIIGGNVPELNGLEMGPGWYLSEADRRKYLIDEERARRRALKDRARYGDQDSDFTSVSQRGEKRGRPRRGWYVP